MMMGMIQEVTLIAAAVVEAVAGSGRNARYVDVKPATSTNLDRIFSNLHRSLHYKNRSSPADRTQNGFPATSSAAIPIPRSLKSSRPTSAGTSPSSSTSISRRAGS